MKIKDFYINIAYTNRQYIQNTSSLIVYYSLNYG